MSDENKTMRLEAIARKGARKGEKQLSPKDSRGMNPEERVERCDQLYLDARKREALVDYLKTRLSEKDKDIESAELGEKRHQLYKEGAIPEDSEQGVKDSVMENLFLIRGTYNSMHGSAVSDDEIIGLEERSKKLYNAAGGLAIAAMQNYNDLSKDLVRFDEDDFFSTAIRKYVRKE